MRRLPHNHEPYTDKYFLRTKKVLEEERLNPHVRVKVFCRSTFRYGEETRDTIEEMISELPNREITFHLREPSTYQPGQPLMVYEGPAQELVDLETVLLGETSSILTAKHTDNGSIPWGHEFSKRVQEAAHIYNRAEIPFLYFGARHYSWREDKRLAGLALSAGAAQTSTYIGSSNIYQDGVGTTPHMLTILLASEHGREDATLETAKAFHEHIDESVPRTILVDTFNYELTDAIEVLEYFNEVEPEAQVGLRIDTCGENVAETGEPGDGPHPYSKGSGVTTTAVWNLHRGLLEEGFEDFRIFVSSGMGKPDKARAFVEASEVFEEEYSRPMFHGVGAGDFADTIQCTADPFMVDGEPLAKTGREVNPDEINSYDFRTVSPGKEAATPDLSMIK